MRVVEVISSSWRAACSEEQGMTPGQACRHDRGLHCRACGRLHVRLLPEADPEDAVRAPLRGSGPRGSAAATRVTAGRCGLLPVQC